MTEIRRGLTWSKKWHIIDETQGNDRYDVALCGAYLYNDAKEKAAWRGASMPNHLQKIIDGTAKSAGECKLCNRSVGRKTVTVELPNPVDQSEVEDLLYDLSYELVSEDDSQQGPRAPRVCVDFDGHTVYLRGVPSEFLSPNLARQLAAALLAAADEAEKGN